MSTDLTLYQQIVPYCDSISISIVICGNYFIVAANKIYIMTISLTKRGNLKQRKIGMSSAMI